MAVRKVTDMATAETVDWSFYDDADVVKRIEWAAWRVIQNYSDWNLDFNDVFQDGLLYVACRPEIVERYENDLPFLQKTVWRYLNENAGREIRNTESRFVSLDALCEAESNDGDGALDSRTANYMRLGGYDEYEAVNFA